MECKICKREFTNNRNPNAEACSRGCNAKLVNIRRSEKFKALRAGRFCLVCERELSTRQEKYCSTACLNKNVWGAKNPMWKGGTKKHPEGYVYRYCPAHPCATCGYVLEHRLVMEGLLYRKLEKHEVVHHINGVKNDNRPENLELFTTQRDHLIDHYGVNGEWFGRNRDFVLSDKKAVNSVEHLNEVNTEPAGTITKGVLGVCDGQA